MKVCATIDHAHGVFCISEPVVDDLDIDEIVRKIKTALQEGHRQIVLSFKASAYPYSGLLTLLVACYRAVHDAGGALGIVSPNPEFTELLRQTHLHRVMEVYASIADAVA